MWRIKIRDLEVINHHARECCNVEEKCLMFAVIRLGDEI